MVYVADVVSVALLCFFGCVIVCTCCMFCLILNESITCSCFPKEKETTNTSVQTETQKWAIVLNPRRSNDIVLASV